MVRFAELLIAFKEYPHTDALERAFELVDLCVAMAQGRIRPVAAVADPRMVGVIHTTRQPGRGLVDRVQALEGRDGVLSISLVHGFPWGDVPDMGAKVLVYTDCDADQAHSIASRIADELFGLREQLVAPYPNIDTALDEALAFDGGPVVMADSADNAGGRSARRDCKRLDLARLDRRDRRRRHVAQSMSRLPAVVVAAGRRRCPRSPAQARGAPSQTATRSRVNTVTPGMSCGHRESGLRRGAPPPPCCTLGRWAAPLPTSRLPRCSTSARGLQRRQHAPTNELSQHIGLMQLNAIGYDRRADVRRYAWQPVHRPETPMAQYVDGFVVPVPRKNLAAYRRMARKAGKVWIEHGALQVCENVADDVLPGKLTSFPQSVKLKDDEVVVFSWIVFASRKQRDRINALVMKDPRLASMMEPTNMQFDGKRMFWGGFKTMVQL